MPINGIGQSVSARPLGVLQRSSPRARLRSRKGLADRAAAPKEQLREMLD
jgi:hypothetical protein